MVSISISFDKNVRTFGNCIKRKWKDFFYFLLPSHINSQSLPLLSSSCLSIKKEFIGFWLNCWCRTAKKYPLTGKKAIGNKKRNHVGKGSEVKKFMIYSASWTREYVTWLHMNYLISNTQTHSSTLSFLL